VRSAEATFTVRGTEVVYEDVRIVGSRGGVATGTVIYDFGKHRTTLKGAKSGVRLRDLAAWFSLDLGKAVEPFAFHSPPFLEFNGVVDDDPERTRLEVKMSAKDGLDYELFDKNLSFDTVQGVLRIDGQRLTLRDFTGRLFGGTVRYDSTVSLDPRSPGYEASVGLDRINFETVTGLYFGYKDSKGLLSGEYSFVAPGDDPRAIKGKGALRVIDGNVFSIPYLGPLSSVLDGIVPGMGFSTAREASASFTVANGRLETGDLEVQGRGFTMLGKGHFLFLEDAMNLSVRINARGIPGVLLFPVSKLFEYVSDGRMSDPVWRPKRLPRGRDPRRGGRQ
jgi:hypothetical protein